MVLVSNFSSVKVEVWPVMYYSAGVFEEVD
jgi:hypothetical protein